MVGCCIDNPTSGGGGGGAPANATFITLTNNPSLTNNRTIAVAATPGLNLTDGGATQPITIGFSAQVKNTFLGGPTTGSNAVPSFRALVAADIPSLSGIYLPLAGGSMTGAVGGGIGNLGPLSFNAGGSTVRSIDGDGITFFNGGTIINGDDAGFYIDTIDATAAHYHFLNDGQGAVFSSDSSSGDILTLTTSSVFGGQGLFFNDNQGSGNPGARLSWDGFDDTLILAVDFFQITDYSGANVSANITSGSFTTYGVLQPTGGIQYPGSGVNLVDTGGNLYYSGGGILADFVDQNLHLSNILVCGTGQIAIQSGNIEDAVGSTGAVNAILTAGPAGSSAVWKSAASLGLVTSPVTVLGRIATYNGITTAGQGLPVIIDSRDFVNQTADIATTNFSSANVAAKYRVGYALEDTTADITAGAVTLTIAYTDAAGAATQTSAAQLLTGVGRTQGMFYIQLSSGNVTFATTHTGIFGSAKYNLYMTIERLN